MASILYTRADYRLMKALIDAYGVGSIKALLAKSTHVPARTHTVVSDVSGDEITAAGYSRQTLAGWAVTEVQAGAAGYATAKPNSVHFGAAAAGQTAGWMIVFIDLGAGDGGNPLLYCADLPDTATDGTDFIVQIDAAGLFGLGA